MDNKCPLRHLILLKLDEFKNKVITSEFPWDVLRCFIVEELVQKILKLELESTVQN